MNILAHHHKVGIPVIATIGPAGLVVAVDIPHFQGGAGDSAFSLLGAVKSQYSGRAKLTFKCREFAATPSRKR